MSILSAIAKYQSYAAVLILAVGAGLVADWQSVYHYRTEQRLAITEVNNDFRSALEQIIHEKILVTEGLAATVAARPNITQREFEQAASSLTRQVEGVINVVGAPNLVIEMIYPVVGNREALGLDLRSRPELMATVERSIATGTTLVDGPIDLVQGGRGLVTRAAVREFDASAFQSDFWGIVSIVFDAQTVFAAAGLTEAREEFLYVVQDETGTAISGTYATLRGDPVMTEIVAPGLDWELSMAPIDGWLTVPPNRAQIWLIALGSALVVLALMRAFRWSLDRKDAAERRLTEAVDALDDAFSLYDADSRFVMCNQRYKELYPSAADLMVPGTHLADLLRRGVETGQYPMAEGREEEWIAERVDAQRNPGAPMENQLADGRWLRVVERRTESGNIAGFRVDITELKQAIAKSEAANAAKTEFLNSVSHELRTPLTVILGYNAFLQNLEALPSRNRICERLKEGDTLNAARQLSDFENELKKFSQQIDTSGQQLLKLIGNMLDMAAIEKGTMELRSEDVDLDATIKSIAEEFADRATAKGIALEFDEANLTAFADPKRLKQILRVLVGNAVKFTEAGSVTVRSNAGAGRAYVEVADTGAGIPAANLAHIFEQFRQGDGSSTRKHGGVGLGLPIAKQLAELQGGTIVASSTEGEGSVFTLELAMPKNAQGEAA